MAPVIAFAGGASGAADQASDACMSRVLHRTGAIPPVAVRGEGIWLHTADGRAIIDASGGAAVAALGHGNRRVAEAIARQASTMAYAHTGTFSNQPAEDLAESLLQRG